MKQDLHEIKQYQDSSFPVEMYTITRNEITPSGRGFMDIHWHEELQLTIVTKGTLSIRVDDTSYILNEGEAIFINRKLLHITTDLTPGGQYVSFNFPDKLLTFFPGSYMGREQVLPYTNSYPFSAVHLTNEISWQQQIIEQIKELMLVFSERKELYQYRSSVLLVEIWLIFISNTPSEIKVPTSTFIRKQTRIQEMLTYVHTHYSSDIHPKDIAESANISIGECNRCFRQMINLSPMQYLLDYRIEKAAELLTQTDLPVTTIALQCGYNNTSYFIQQFHKKMNVTPREYRALQQE